jgi:hypothetical protein
VDLQDGLLRGSLAPPWPTREFRDLTRYRLSLAQEINFIANRIQKVPEAGNIRLASVATDALGASGRAILEAMLVRVQDSARPAAMCRGAEQHPGTQRWCWRTVRRTSSISASTAGVRESKRSDIGQEVGPRMRPLQDGVIRPRTNPGVDQVTAPRILSEIGLRMITFRLPRHLSS